MSSLSISNPLCFFHPLKIIIKKNPFHQTETVRPHRKPIKAPQELANPTLEETQIRTGPEPEGERNKWAVRYLYEALNHRDVDRVHQLLTPDIEWWFNGPPVHQHMMRLLTGAAPDDTFEFLPLTVESIGPETVVVEGCDKSRTVFWVHAWRVNADGIITEVREYFNTSVTVTAAHNCLPVWESKLPAGKSLPGLVLAL